MVKTVLVLLMAYVLGSIPTAFLLVKGVYGRDIRRTGSHNVGAMNVARHISFGLGLLTVFLDILKGVLAVLLAKYWMGTTLALVLAPVLVVAGDIWPIFFGFKGGKGLAAATGVLLAMNIWIAFLVILLLGIVTLITQNANLGAIVSFVALPFIAWWQMGGFGWFFFGIIFALPILVKHVSLPQLIPLPKFLSH